MNDTVVNIKGDKFRGKRTERHTALSYRTDEFQKLVIISLTSQDRAKYELFLGSVTFQGIFLDGNELNAGAFQHI